METLNYEVLAKSGYNGYILKNAPEKVLQFGEGNFLRAFVDYWFDLANTRCTFIPRTAPHPMGRSITRKNTPSTVPPTTGASSPLRTGTRPGIDITST